MGDEELERIAKYLLTLRKPSGLSEAELTRFCREATQYLVRDGVSYRRGKGGSPPPKVVAAGDKENIL